MKDYEVNSNRVAGVYLTLFKILFNIGSFLKGSHSGLDLYRYPIIYFTDIEGNEI